MPNKISVNIEKMIEIMARLDFFENFSTLDMKRIFININLYYLKKYYSLFSLLPISPIEFIKFFNTLFKEYNKKEETNEIINRTYHPRSA